VNSLQQVVPRRYTSKDFDAYRAEAFEHARTFFGKKIKDLSESGLGGLMIDTCAMVGDSLSFYLDHQFGELDPQTAVETKNLQRLARAAGVKLSGASPSYVNDQRFFVKVPAIRAEGAYQPDYTLLPVIKAGAVISDGTTDFTLLEDVDLSVTGSDGSLTSLTKIADRTADGSPKSFVVSQTGVCSSGREVDEPFSVGATFVPFRQVTLSRQDITQITSVVDSAGNTYYEVGSLTHDTVYLSRDNASDDVPATIIPTPAPYRFVSQYDPATRLTTLVFGGGSALTLDSDATPDPSTFALPFRGKRVFDRVSVTPEKLLQTKTLGIAATNVTLTVSYRCGGGLSHNAIAGKISSVKTARLIFPSSSSPALTAAVKSTLVTSNDSAAGGGEDPLTIEMMRAVISAARASQDRIVTKEDLIARVYSMPSQFGRVFRVGVGDDSLNPGASQLFVVSRDSDALLCQSPDSLKQNMVKWLNPHRLIADAIEIRDAIIINLRVRFEITVSAGLNKSVIVNRAAAALAEAMSSDASNINQTISIDALKSTLFSVTGVAAVSSLSLASVSGDVSGRTYPGQLFDVIAQTRKGVLIPPLGGIFELRYPDVDVIGRAT